MRLKFFILFLITASVFSQEKYLISGKVLTNAVLLPDILVELKTGSISKFFVTNSKGEYMFDYLTQDSVFIKVNNSGYKVVDVLVDANNKNTILNINLEVIEPEYLNEVVVKAEEKVGNTAKKMIYQINQQDYLKNARVNEVLQSVPNIYFNEFDEKILVDGNLKGKIFIDGLEAMPNELRTIKAEDIKSVEVINNPSAGYFKTDFLGAIINVITKKKSENFFKGELESTLGVRNKYLALSPNFSFKKDFFLIRTNFHYLTNDQIIDFSSNRVDSNGTYYQSNVNHSLGKQFSSTTRIALTFNDKSSFTLSNNISQYRFSGQANGFTILNKENAESFFKNDNESMLNWKIASVFSFKIHDNNALFVKSAYSIFDNVNKSEFNYSDNISEYYNVQSKNNELSLQINHELEKLSIFDKNMAFYSDVKYINRMYRFLGESFYVNQNVFDASVELDTDWTDKFSTELSLTYEYINISNQLLDQNYNLLIPIINSLYHFKNKLDLKFGYSRKVLRPSASDLNDEVLILYPGVAKQGNSELDPQLRNYNFLMLSKFYKSSSFSFKFYNESINNAITEVYRKEGNLLIQTLANAARYNAIGVNVGFKTKLFQKVVTNLNSGFDYNVYKDNSENAVIKKNSGYTFRGSVNLRSAFFKDKVSVSVSGRQDGPDYSLLSKRITIPYLVCDISTNVFKDKLNISLYGQNLLGSIAGGFTDISSYNDFYQKIEIKNNSRNLLLTLTYNFGKKFSDKIESQDINNSDVRR